MENIKITMDNCYGINRLDAEFKFNKFDIYTIYAPNGSMKTSFAKAMKDYSEVKEPKDLVYHERKSNITIRGVEAFPNSSVMVIDRYSSNYDARGISSLLVNEKLSAQYSAAHKDIDETKSKLLAKLKQLSHFTNEGAMIEELMRVVGSNDVIKSLLLLKSKVSRRETTKYGSLMYGELFNESTKSVLESSVFKHGVGEYIDKYNELLNNTRFLKNGFDHYNANQVQTSLSNNGFFDASHSIVLKSGDETHTVSSNEELVGVIKAEMDSVINSQEIRPQFDAIEKLFKNTGSRQFRSILNSNKHIIPELSDIHGFKLKMWIDYLSSPDCYALYESFLSTYDEKSKEIEEIVRIATTQQTQWKSVVEKFNKRFDVPFEVVIVNQVDAILNKDRPSAQFIYKDSSEDARQIDKSDLTVVLSEGEKRALYLMQVIFDIEARRATGEETILVIDDIADSFDYKNKYAIIEYLEDIKNYGNFKMIIMTHNFDFYRTIISRLSSMGNNHLIASRTSTVIKLDKSQYQGMPFSRWVDKAHEQVSFLIALIPYIRNLAEYTMNNEVKDYLTNLVHIKDETDSITINSLLGMFKKVCPTIKQNHPQGEKKVIDLIYDTAESIVENKKGDLEHKIVLAMAIRLLSEMYMKNTIPHTILPATFGPNQSRELFKIVSRVDGVDPSVIATLQSVMIMTPENIHLNSFMYEPILDMDIANLIRLYKDVIGLIPEATIGEKND